MRFLASLLAGAAALSSLVAASSGLALTNSFSSVTAGQAVDIKYTASDLTVPVTITLRKGDPLNLDTVGVITSSATGGSFTWTPDTTLTDATDYALQLTQGDQINYSGQFSVTGGSGTASSSSASASATASITASASATSASASSTTSVNITSSILSLSSSIVASANSSISSISSAAHNSTATLSTLTTSASASSAASSTSDSNSGTSATGSSQTSAATSGANNGLKSPMALVFGAVAAMAYLQ